MVCYCCVLVTKSCLFFVTPWMAACQATLSMGFPRGGYWSGWSFPFPRDLHDQACVFFTAGKFFTTEPHGKPGNHGW